MEYQFNIDDGLLRRSIELLRISLQDTNHDYLSFEKIPTYREKRRNNEVDFVSDEDSKNEDFKGLRKEIALRLRYFHHYVGNAGISQANREYHEVTLETDDVLEFLQKYIVSCARRYLHDSGTDDQRTLDQFGYDVEKIFNYSQLFVVPFPPPIYLVPHKEDNLRPTKRQKGTSDASHHSVSFTRTRGFFESFRQIQADVIDENEDMQQVKLRFVRQCGPIQTDYSPESIYDKSGISTIVYNGILQPVRRLLQRDFHGIHLMPDFYNNSMSIPDYCFIVKIGNSKFNIPIELKLSGVYNSFEKKDSSFSYLINESMYQMLEFKSSMGYVFDKECIMIIKLINNEMSEFAVEESSHIRIARVKCNIQCIRYNDLNPALMFYKSILNYLLYVTKDDKNRVESIFNSIK
ncbi:hypothetical protein DFJ63DRAFT_318719 [Scheffersomyces coipomensis]|uniref:uncharacterized protein n=1 Tax=Scheffersomyces coipomensis TaxID=1788519 RepID=UPI00315D0148